MGYRLYREVIEHAPPDVTSGELVVWLVIADDANDDTRIGWIANEVLSARARMTGSGVVKNLRRLASRGYELRVARGTDKSGRPVYAYRGAQSTYRLPVLALERVDHSPAITEGKGGPQATLSTEKGWTTVPERVDHSPGKGGPQGTPSPQSPQSPQQRVADLIAERTGATVDEAAAVVELIQQTKQPRSLVPFVRRLADDGELPGLLADVRHGRERQTLDAWVTSLATRPPCEHGYAGGDQIRPDTGEPQCPICRRRRARNLQALPTERAAAPIQWRKTS